MSDVFDLFCAPAQTPTPPETPLPDDPREQFRVLQERLKAAQSFAQAEGIQTAFDKELAARMEPLLPKGKRKKTAEPPLAHKVLGDEVYTEIRSRYEGLMEVAFEERRQRTDALKEHLNRVADQVKVLPGPEWTKAESVSSSNYNTQGLGAHSYARSKAEMLGLQYEMCGLEAEIRANHLRDQFPDDPRFAKSNTTYYEVWVKASEEDCAITKAKSGLSLKDWMQACWDRQRNPRVYNPFLPHGLEEKLGVVINRVRQ